MKLLAVYTPPGLSQAIYAQDVFPIPAHGLHSNEDLARILDHKVRGVKAALLREVDRQEVPLWRTEEVGWSILLTDDDLHPGDPKGYVHGIAAAIHDIFLADFRCEVLRVAL